MKKNNTGAKKIIEAGTVSAGASAYRGAAMKNKTLVSSAAFSAGSRRVESFVYSYSR